MGFTKAAQSAKMAIIFENSQNISKFFWLYKFQILDKLELEHILYDLMF